MFWIIKNFTILKYVRLNFQKPIILTWVPIIFIANTFMKAKSKIENKCL